MSVADLRTHLEASWKQSWGSMPGSFPLMSVARGSKLPQDVSMLAEVSFKMPKMASKSQQDGSKCPQEGLKMDKIDMV